MLDQGGGMLCAKRVELRRDQAIPNNLALRCGREDTVSVLARRFTKYMVANQYIDTSVRKGGVEGLAGCWEQQRKRI